MSVSASVAYTPIPTIVLDDGESQPEEMAESFRSVPLYSRKVALSVKDKWTLVRPLVGRYMLPLCESSLPLF